MTAPTAADFNTPLEALLDRTACLVPKVFRTSVAVLTWTKHPLAIYIDVVVVGRGAAGANGHLSIGGAGGAASTPAFARFAAADFPATLFLSFGGGKASAQGPVTGGQTFFLQSLDASGQSTTGTGGAAAGSGGVSGSAGLAGLDAHATKGGAGGLGGNAGGAAPFAAGGIGGSGYGAGGGGGGGDSSTVGGGGGGGGDAGYGSQKLAVDGGVAGSSVDGIGGAGGSPVIIITQWCGVAI